ncbi:hypothetical protein NW762_001694 [Fusarium torreyae]|uniref:Uncharacterized protein n=1 Tax=Fusarium torreyae TaxID=1237075 RepID=A0A9W8VLG0_9HYPO|nr:hypothetical protein NW762_001694 [Fusarium torreyae]
MCYYEQIRWACGYWRWGQFRQQCSEYKKNEQCTLKLVYETKTESDVCKLCHDTEKKQRQYEKMYRDVQRWQREGSRNATIEQTCGEMQVMLGVIHRMREEHYHRLQSLGQYFDSDSKSKTKPTPTQPASSSIASGSMQTLVQVPHNMEDALRSNSIEGIAAFLDDRFDQASSGDYVWIRELRDVGYTNLELAQLLHQRACDSPWIYFEPTTAIVDPIKLNQHLPGCAHHMPTPDSYDALQPRPELNTDLEVLRVVEEGCGLGGISPSSRNADSWNGTVEFQHDNSKALIRYGAPESFTDPLLDLSSRLGVISRSFKSAIVAVQVAGLCCDSFTVLSVTSHPSTLYLSRITFETIHIFISRLQDLPNPNITFWTLQALKIYGELHRSSQGVISGVISPESLPRYRSPAETLHMASLALQFLCLGFLSYVQGHIGKLHPFFLDTALEKITLLGTRASPSAPGPYLSARSVELTCLSSMCQGPVIAFSGSNSQNNLEITTGVQRYDVRACPEDILDTWGPGELISRPTSPDMLLAIKIGNGYIGPSQWNQDEAVKYHWDHSFASTSNPFRLDLKRAILIGSLVVPNPGCTNDEKRCWKASSHRFKELGAYNSYSEVTEHEIGFQGGPENFAITANRTWAKRRGKTIKEVNFETGNYKTLTFLEFYWGVRVSFCTGVAQRVLLRQLVADLLPAFADCNQDPTLKDHWESLTLQHDVFGQFGSQEVLSAWLTSLPRDHRHFILNLIQQILETLKCTGLSPDARHFSVAWPQSGFINRCLHVPVTRGHNRWIPMLADSADCATFAYISNTCLEAGKLTCRGPNPEWEGQVHMLETAVCCAEGPGSWTLCPEQTYFFQKVDNTLFWVRAQREGNIGKPPLGIFFVREIAIRSVPRDVIQRILVAEERRRRRCLREKNVAWITAEQVTVLDEAMCRSS